VSSDEYHIEELKTFPLSTGYATVHTAHNVVAISSAFLKTYPWVYWLVFLIWHHLQRWWQCVNSCSSLIEMSKRKGPDVDTCGSPLVTGIQVKYDPLTFW